MKGRAPKRKKPTTDRSAIIRAVRSRDTAPEKIVRKVAWQIRPGYRLHRKDIPGRPDVAYVGAKKAIFMHGCFWHGHHCARGARVPKANREYWLGKVGRNRARDEQSLKRLEESGWQALVLWECELKNSEQVRRRLEAFLAR